MGSGVVSGLITNQHTRHQHPELRTSEDSEVNSWKGLVLKRGLGKHGGIEYISIWYIYLYIPRNYLGISVIQVC